jgi:subtilisin family serine protease
MGQVTAMIPSEAVQRRVLVPHGKKCGCLDQVASNPDLIRSVSEGASASVKTGWLAPQGLVRQTRSAAVAFTQCDQGKGDRIAREWSWVALVQH